MSYYGNSGHELIGDIRCRKQNCVGIGGCVRDVVGDDGVCRLQDLDTAVSNNVWRQATCRTPEPLLKPRFRIDRESRLIRRSSLRFQIFSGQFIESLARRCRELFGH